MGREARVKRDAPKGNPKPVQLQQRLAKPGAAIVAFSDRAYEIHGGTFRRLPVSLAALNTALAEWKDKDGDLKSSQVPPVSFIGPETPKPPGLEAETTEEAKNPYV